MWRTVPSVSVIVFRKEPIRFLLLERSPEKGHMFLPITATLEEGEPPERAAQRAVKDIGLEVAIMDLVDLGHSLTYYARETKHLQKVFGVEASVDLEPGKVGEHLTSRWTSFEEGLRLLTLTSHKKALVKLMLGKVYPDAPVATGYVSMFEHVPVEHPSGVVFMCDFDGTVTIGEASIAILKTFAPEAWEEYEEAWLRKELTTHECLGLQFTIIGSPIEEMAQFVAENVELRPGFKEFVPWCKRNGHGLVITSSGIDFYIKAILDRHGLGAVPFLANRAIWIKDQGLVIEEGMVNEDCDECGNCKAQLVEHYQARDAMVVFVGDGITDECPAKEADRVFARRSLLEYCEKEGIEAVPFESFDDVMEGFG
jgi:2-hydroxy-3-keto-5-methylthiopentenyl-1-phosphate phosphatase